MKSEFPLEELKEGLLKAREADKHLKYFGASSHKYQWNPPASLSEIEAFEQRIGTTLPEEYREFLLKAGNGGAGPYYGLFSIEEVNGWLDWEVEPEKEPWLYPGMEVPDPEEWPDYEGNVDRGSIPIASLGDSYFLHLMVSGPHRGRVVYLEAELLYIFFPREKSFLAWYTRWLREVAKGYHIFWYGTNLDGEEEELCQCYQKAVSKEERWLILQSMQKFPFFSKETAELVEHAAKEYLHEGNSRLFAELLHRISPKKRDAYLELLWEEGEYEEVIFTINYAINHLNVNEQACLEHWGTRILLALPKIPQSSWYMAFGLLTKCSKIRLSDAIDLWEIAEPENRPSLLRSFGNFADAREHLDFFLKFLDEREDVEMLGAAVLAVPDAASEVLLEKLHRICKDLEFSMEYKPYKVGEEEEWQRRNDQASICQNAWCTIRNVKELIINPPVYGIPRSHILKIIPDQPWKRKEDYELDDFGIHPLIALVLQETYGRLPSTKWDWNHLFEKIQRLYLVLDEKYLAPESAYLEDFKSRHQIYIRKPDEYGWPDRTYRYDIYDWSAIGRMKNLKVLKIEEICVEDFSFLTQCQNLQKLSLYNTNFTDCRLLQGLSKLRYVDLRYCKLEYIEVLEALEGIEVLTS